MGDNRIESFYVKPPAAPGNNGTAILFDSTTMLGGEAYKGLRINQIDRIIVSFLSVDQASAAAGLKNFASSDNGANWDPVAAGVATIITAGAVQQSDFPVQGYDDYRITWLAGATGPTVWRLSIQCVCGQRGAVT